jgi:hypothetical protein
LPNYADDGWIKQRIRFYKKRHARYIQKRIAAQRAGRKVTSRILQAEANNGQWVEFYKELLNAQRQVQKPVLEVA